MPRSCSMPVGGGRGFGETHGASSRLKRAFRAAREAARMASERRDRARPGPATGRRPVRRAASWPASAASATPSRLQLCRRSWPLSPATPAAKASRAAAGQARRVGGQEGQGAAAVAACRGARAKDRNRYRRPGPRAGEPASVSAANRPRAVLEHLADRGGHQIVLGGEVGVEAAVGQAGLGHHLGDADLVRPLGADRLGRLLQNPLPGLLLVLGVVAHGLASPFI